MAEQEKDNLTRDCNRNIEPVSLGRQAIRGGLWVFGLRISSRVLQFISVLILARLLIPEDFGLMGIVLVTIATLEAFLQTGFTPALVQKKGDVEEYLATAWTVNMIRGFFLCMVLEVSAPFVAKFFADERVTYLLRVVGIGLILRGLTNIRVLYFQKELQFNKEFVFQISGTVANMAVAIPLAVIYRSVWALVAGHLTGHLVRLVVSYVLIPTIPRFVFKWTQFKEMFAFGKWVLFSGILIFLATQGDDIFVGKVLGAVALGLYQLAYRISNMPATEITHVISQVTFPAYSKMQDDTPRLQKAYLKVFQLTMFFSFLIAGMIFALGKDFTRLFLGEEWLPMVPALQVMVVLGMARSIGATAGAVLYAVGKPNIDTLWQFVRVAILFGLIYPLTMKWGIVGASVAATLSMVISGFGLLLTMGRIVGIEFRRIVEKLLFFSIGAMVLIAFVSVLGTCDSILTFLFFTIVGVLLYLGAIWLLDKLLGYGLWVLIREQLAALRGKERCI